MEDGPWVRGGGPSGPLTQRGDWSSEDGRNDEVGFLLYRGGRGGFVCELAGVCLSCSTCGVASPSSCAQGSTQCVWPGTACIFGPPMFGI